METNISKFLNLLCQCILASIFIIEKIYDILFSDIFISIPQIYIYLFLLSFFTHFLYICLCIFWLSFVCLMMPCPLPLNLCVCFLYIFILFNFLRGMISQTNSYMVNQKQSLVCPSFADTKKNCFFQLLFIQQLYSTMQIHILFQCRYNNHVNSRQ